MFILYPLQSEHIEAIQYSFIKLKQNPVFASSITLKALFVIFHYALCRGLFFFSASELVPDDRRHLCQVSRPYGDRNGLLEERDKLGGRTGAQQGHWASWCPALFL